MKITLRNYLADERIQELRNSIYQMEEAALLDGRPLNNEEATKKQEIEKKIEYIDSNCYRTYTAPFLKGQYYKEFFEIRDKLANTTDADVLVDAASFICAIYGNQFTEKQFLNGMSLQDAISEISNCMVDIQKKINGDKQDTQR